MGIGSDFGTGIETDASGNTWYYAQWSRRAFNRCRRGVTKKEDLIAMLFTFADVAPSEIYAFKMVVDRREHIVYLKWREKYDVLSDGKIALRSNQRKERARRDYEKSLSPAKKH